MIARVLRLGLLLVGACVGACVGTASTGTTRSSAPESASTYEVVGRVTDYTTAPQGEMDGVILADGTRIHFSPRAGSALLPLVQRGQTIRVVGWRSYGAGGERIEADTITSVGNGRTVDVTAMARSEEPTRAPRERERERTVAPPAPRAPEPAPSTTLTGAELTSTEGRIDGYTTTLNGDMDGLLLSNGARVHFPPHAGATLLPLVQRGTNVRVTGWQTSGPNGLVLEASKVSSSTTGRTVDVASIPAPRPTSGAVAPPPAPSAPAPGSAPPPTRVR